jgi:polyhydroxybutyrate depolymerase
MEMKMRPLQLILAAFVIGAVSSTAEAQTVSAATESCALPHATGVAQSQLVSGQRQRTYRLFVPPSYDSRTRLPLVLDLHGSGGSSAGQARTSGFEAVAARDGFVVATLQAEGALWNVPVQEGRPDDVAYVADVIDHVAAGACIDVTRVYVTGFSGGGRMTSLVGCKLGARIAAIAPVSGLRWPAPCPGRPIPVLTFHGLADRQNPYAGHAGRGPQWLESVPEALAGWAGRNGCDRDMILDDPDGPLSTMRYESCQDGAAVRMIRVDGLGHAWTKREVDTTEVMWQFFSGHRLR